MLQGKWQNHRFHASEMERHSLGTSKTVWVTSDLLCNLLWINSNLLWCEQCLPRRGVHS